MEARINRRSFVFGASCSLCGSMILPSCTQVPLTNRSQLNLYDSNLPIILMGGGVLGTPKIYPNEKSLNQEVEKTYSRFLSKAKEDKILLDNTDESKKIEEIGKEIYTSLDTFYLNKREKNPVENFNWQFALIESDTKNAWCMPGGKIAFYTGILPVCKNDDGIAAVMGHEIAHAVARHSVERASQALAINVGTTILDIALEGALSNTSADDYLVNLGLSLPFNRLQESEADYLGLAFMTMAKYDNHESYKVWQRMAEAQKGNAPPEFLSTHPSPKNRIEKLKNWIPEVDLRFT